MIKKNTLTWLILLLLFFGSPISAWYLYTYHSDRLTRTIHKGTLIQPLIPTKTLSLFDLNTQQKINTEQFQGKWLLMYITTQPCVETCQKDLYKMRQVHVALGKEQSRVERIAVTTSDIETGLYIVDPQGNVMMRYPLDVVPRALKDDLSRLLKVSQIG